MRLFGFIIKFFFFLIFLLSAAAGSITVFSLQENPLVTQRHTLNATEISRVKSFINKNNPSYFKNNRKRTTTISEQDINLLTRYFLNKLDDNARARTKFFTSTLYLTGTLKLPANPFGNYLNISAEIVQQGESIIIKSLEIGDITIPHFMSDLLLITIHRELLKQVPEYHIAINSITGFQFNRQQLSISYIWRDEVVRQFKNRIATSLISKNLKTRLFIYTQQLKIITQSIHQPRPSLTELLKPMFSFAIKRSKDNNPVEENRALFIVLGAYMINKNIPQILGDPSIGRLKNKTFYLLKRKDLSQHLLVSAALTALSDSTLAQSIGLEKEIKDSDGGSGFSFSDLAADRAGVTLANTALSSERQAHLLQLALSKTNYESDFMPNIDNLSDGLRGIDFRMIYLNTNSASYKQVIAVIDRRISACNIYH